MIYCYGEYQKEFDELPPNVELVQGFPDNLSDMVRGHDHSLIVLDDLMLQCSNDQRVADLFTHGISTLAKQMFPAHTDYLMESFSDTTSRPYGYVVIDCHQLTPKSMCLRTNI